MKKWIGLAVFPLLFLSMLTACNKELQISGQIVEVNMDEKIGLTSFVVKTEDKEVGVLMTDETAVLSMAEGMDQQTFLAGEFTEIEVSVKYDASPRTLTKQGGEELVAYNAQEIDILSFLIEETRSLTDGTPVEVWKETYATVYKLKDGTELLREADSSGPAEVYVGSSESLNDLNETVQKKISEFYEEQGLLYDLETELEVAYQDYLKNNKTSAFETHIISQDVVPTASSDSVIYFLTSVLLPIDESHGYEKRVGAAFDKETGEHISNFDLFSCDQEEILQELISISGETDQTVIKEMKQAFRPENIILFPENLEVCFEYGALPGQENTYLLGFDYDEELLEMLYEWAVPKK